MCEVQELAAAQRGPRLGDARMRGILLFIGYFSDFEVEPPLIGHRAHLMQVVHVAEDALDVQRPRILLLNEHLVH